MEVEHGAGVYTVQESVHKLTVLQHQNLVQQEESVLGSGTQVNTMQYTGSSQF